MRPPPEMLPAAVLLAGACLLVVFYREVRRRRLSAERRRLVPQGGRAPGREVLAEIDRINQEVGDFTHGSLAFLVLFVGVIVATAAFGDPTARSESAAVSGAVGVVLFSIALTRLLRLTRVCKDLKRRYDGRIEVVRALNALESEGFRLYHDLRGEKFSIHHVAVGERGVFAVETASGVKAPKSGRVEDATVAYNGHSLFFPRWTDDQTIRRAEERAQWLSERLEHAIGEPVAVRAVVALPGWFVKRTTPEGIPVVHPGQVASLFRHIKPRPLSSETCSRIAHHLDQATR
ncbi:MAG: NERD domain-containing protein [Desulfobacterales bacterium]